MCVVMKAEMIIVAVVTHVRRFLFGKLHGKSFMVLTTCVNHQFYLVISSRLVALYLAFDHMSAFIAFKIDPTITVAGLA